MTEKQGFEQSRFISGQRWQFVVRENIKAESVHKMLDQLFNEVGCPACGLVGIDDLMIRVRDDRLFERFEGIEGLQDVSVMGR
ncbi:MAG TPA: hypothetical protein VFZ66_30050 [Herpetosiphonaceae bacterium]